MKAMVPQKFYKWLKVFGKMELERMPTRKIWDYTIDVMICSDTYLFLY